MKTAKTKILLLPGGSGTRHDELSDVGDGLAVAQVARGLGPAPVHSLVAMVPAVIGTHVLVRLFPIYRRHVIVPVGRLILLVRGRLLRGRLDWKWWRRVPRPLRLGRALLETARGRRAVPTVPLA